MGKKEIKIKKAVRSLSKIAFYLFFLTFVFIFAAIWSPAYNIQFAISAPIVFLLAYFFNKASEKGKEEVYESIKKGKEGSNENEI